MKEAASFRTRKSSIYDKKSNSPFKISRSKFFNFLSCKRCFYLDRVKGLKEPSIPGWALNVAVDELLKKEFDFFQNKGFLIKREFLKKKERTTRTNIKKQMD